MQRISQFIYGQTKNIQTIKRYKKLNLLNLRVGKLDFFNVFLQFLLSNQELILIKNKMIFFYDYFLFASFKSKEAYLIIGENKEIMNGGDQRAHPKTLTMQMREGASHLIVTVPSTSLSQKQDPEILSPQSAFCMIMQLAMNLKLRLTFVMLLRI